MYIAALVGSIAAFVCSFTPLLGIPFTLVFSITSIVFSILVFKKSDEKERKDASIIALIIAIIAIIICIGVNILSCKFIIEGIKYLDNYSVDYENYYEQKFNEYKEYSINDEIKIGDSYIITLNDFSKDGNDYYADITLESLKDYNDYISIYDFCIYNLEEEDVLYSTYSSDTCDFIGGVFDEGEKKNILLKFDSYFENDDNLYLVYINDENGVKIKL